MVSDLDDEFSGVDGKVGAQGVCVCVCVIDWLSSPPQHGQVMTPRQLWEILNTLHLFV